MSIHTIDDPRVESERRNTQQEKELSSIMAGANLPLVAYSFHLEGSQYHPGKIRDQKQVEEDLGKLEDWLDDREALYGFATGALGNEDPHSFKDKEAAMRAAGKDPEHELAMKDPTVYFQRVIGGLAKFYQPRSEGSMTRRFTFTRPAHEATVSTTGIREVSYRLQEGSDLPASFSIDFDLPEGFAFGGRVSLNENHDLVVEKTSRNRSVEVDEDKAPAYYQAAATLLYRAVCNYDPSDDDTAKDALHWSPEIVEALPPVRRKKTPRDMAQVVLGNFVEKP